MSGLAWMARAACRGADTEAFFADVGHAAAVRVARRVCEACPVRAECLAYALELGELYHGVFGGLSPDERRELATGRPRRRRREVAA